MTKITPALDAALVGSDQITADLASAAKDVLTDVNFVLTMKPDVLSALKNDLWMDLLRLHSQAKPHTDDDWGSDRQLAAEAKFIDAIEFLKIDTDAMVNIKATTEEWMEDLMKIAEGILDA